MPSCPKEITSAFPAQQRVRGAADDDDNNKKREKGNDAHFRAAEQGCP
jgi:hypothetical protein